MWYLRPGESGEFNWWPTAALTLPADRNAAAAVLALAGGDRNGALTRLHENVAAAWRLFRDPGWPAVYSGLAILGHAVADLGAMGRALEDGAVSAEAYRLRTVYDSLKPRVVEFWWGGQNVVPAAMPGSYLLFADPDHPGGLRDIADTTLPPSSRFQMAAAIRWSYCANAREILFGIDRRRKAMMDAARLRLADIPRSGDWVGTHARALDLMIADPWREFVAEHMAAGGIVGIPAALGMRGVAARIGFCMAQM
jgi:hypothetical protein